MKARPPAKLLMIQGVSSNAGKSIVCGAMSRYFHQEGYAVAPFKPILLCDRPVDVNGLITDTRFLYCLRGAHVEPQPKFNPLQMFPLEADDFGGVLSPVRLRFPNGGEEIVPLYARDTPAFPLMTARLRRRIRELISKTLNALMEEYDLVIVEGAGNPTDLGRDDLTNYYVTSTFPVKTILVTKISAAGAAASLIGTISLMKETARRAPIAFLLNDLLDAPQLARQTAAQLEKRTKLRSLGILPNRWLVGRWSSQEEELEGLAAVVRSELAMGWLARRLGLAVA